MSELEFQRPSGSSGLGLTFVRPMPQTGTVSHQQGEGSSIQEGNLSLVDRLFPPRIFDDSESLPPVAGLELGHFLIEERIGRGGMGAVFRAMDKRLGRIVALKVLSAEHSSDPEAILRFQNEARAAARLDHENISRVHYIGEEHGLHFIAFEFVMGTNVRDFIRQKGFLTAAESVNFTLQIAEALRHTSAANVVHRDIKPSNIIISPTGRAKLVDLGLARHSQSEMSRELTTVGTALGTFDYISPEQAIDARNVDVRSDIYSLGCTLYHMLTGNPPYPTGTMFEKVMNHHRPVPPNPAEKNRQVSPQLGRVVQKMMAANPDERYATPESLIADLIQIADSLGLEPTPPDSMIWQMPLFDRRSSRWTGLRTWSAVVLILLLLVLADRLRFDSPSRQSQTSSPTTTLAPSDTAIPERSATTSDLDETEPTTPDRKPFVTVPAPFSTDSQTSVPPVVSPMIPVPGKDTSKENLLTPLNLPETWWDNAGSPTPKPENSTTIDSSMPSTSTSRDKSSIGDQKPDVSPAPGETTSKSTNSTSVSPQTSTGSSSRKTPALTKTSFVVVDPMTDQRFPKSTLASACETAKDGWTIEIPANASPLVLQDAIRITEKRITIRPDQEYREGRDARPVLRVDVASQMSLGVLSRSAEMFSLDEASLDLQSLDIEMIVDPSSIANWSLVTLENNSRLSAEGVSFTMVNPGNSRATLVYLPEDESANNVESMPERLTTKMQTVNLKDCVGRGQFDFVVQENSMPLVVKLQNTALALSGSLLRINGSETSIMEMDVSENRVTELLLEHSTVVAARGILNGNSGDYGVLPRIEIDINDCVIRIDQPLQPFLEVSGNEEFEVLRDKIRFQDNRNPNFLEIAGPFAVIDSSTSRMPGKGRELTPDQLEARNMHLILENLVMLPTQVELNDWDRIQTADLHLRPGDDNPAFGASGDLQNSGVNWQSPRLPHKFPPRQTKGGESENSGVGKQNSSVRPAASSQDSDY